MTVPSGRRISTRRIVPGAMSVLSWRSMMACRSVATAPGAKSSGDTKLRTNARTTVVSVPTTELSVFVEKWAETMTAWAVAVTPTMTRKMPYTSRSRTGFGMRAGRPEPARCRARRDHRHRAERMWGPRDVVPGTKVPPRITRNRTRRIRAVAPERGSRNRCNGATGRTG